MLMDDDIAGNEQVIDIQKSFGLSDGKLAKALCVTRQTIRNWRRGEPCPMFVQNALRWMLALHRLDPLSDDLPASFRREPAANDNKPDEQAQA